jgi:hypothetical protein
MRGRESSTQRKVAASLTREPKNQAAAPSAKVSPGRTQMYRIFGAIVYAAALASAGPAHLPRPECDCLLQWSNQQHDDLGCGGVLTIALRSNEPGVQSHPGAHPHTAAPASELERVIARYTEQLVLDPTDDDAYFRRGVASLYAGLVSNAMADVSRASELDPSYPYYAIWLDLMDRRSKLPSRLGQAVAHFDMSKWPAPVIGLYLGRSTPGEVLAAAANPDPETQNGQMCEANFYIGQLSLQRHAPGEAAQRFRLAAISCPPDFVEGPAARAELAALGMAKD